MGYSPIDPFKYISCYCLSKAIARVLGCTLEFKYISCYCLSFKEPVQVFLSLLFKYISCYCLSRFPAGLGSVLLHSNTSHVIVYLMMSAGLVRSLLIQIHLMLLFIAQTQIQTAEDAIFKYISCYCLSMGKYKRGIVEEIFKYISCYCLSSRTFLGLKR